MAGQGIPDGCGFVSRLVQALSCTVMDAPRLQFPCEYPIKVVARAREGLHEDVDAVVFRHAGERAAGRTGERASAQANFISITYVIRATGEAQLAALFAELKQVESVLLVL